MPYSYTAFREGKQEMGKTKNGDGNVDNRERGWRNRRWYARRGNRRERTGRGKDKQKWDATFSDEGTKPPDQHVPKLRHLTMWL